MLDLFLYFFDILLNFDLVSAAFELQLLDSATTEPLLGNCGVDTASTTSCAGFLFFGICFGVPFEEVTVTGTRGGNCPAAAMTKIGAAFATIGYYVQSDLLDFLSFGMLNKLAPLVYTMAALGGFIGVAMGAPPKNYVWFVLGPSIYMFLIDTREPVHGVEWVVAKRIQNMDEVWRIAETGIVGTNYYLRMTSGDAGEYYWRGAPAAFDVSKNSQPTEPARPSMPFVWFDAVVSHMVQYMIAWTGAGYARDPNSSRAAGVSQADSTIANMASLPFAPGGFDHNRWYLLSNLKWKYVDSITAARVQSTYLRDVFHTFMSSECGERLRKSLDQEEYVASQLTKGGDFTAGTQLPRSVFLHEDVANLDYIPTLNELQGGGEVPIPELLRDLLIPNFDNGFSSSFSWGTHPGFGPVGTNPDRVVELLSGNATSNNTSTETVYRGVSFLARGEMDCVPLFNIIMFGFRYEAGHYYHQIFRRPSARPENIREAELLYNIFYGWEIRDTAGTLMAEGTGGLPRLTRVTKQLILLHLLRNELAIAYNDETLGIRYTAGQKAENISEGYNRNIATKSKFGEMYTYGALVPYLQGLVLYFLALAYPFACLMIIVPGMHKTLFTWASFWAWVKLWDLGFAMVYGIERVLWSMLGNNSNMTGALGTRIVDSTNAEWITSSPTDITYSNGVIGVSCPAGWADTDCSVPLVTLRESANPGDPMHILESFPENMRLLDNAMTMGTSLDLDVVNAYYIFIVSGMYLAVPAIAGQLVLGAKAGAASLATNMISGAASEAGAAAKSHAQGETVQQMKSAQNAIEQSAFASSMRAGGANSLAAQSIGKSNASAAAGMEAAMHGQAGQMYGAMNSQNQLGLQSRQARVDAVGGTIGAGAGIAGAATSGTPRTGGNPKDPTNPSPIDRDGGGVEVSSTSNPNGASGASRGNQLANGVSAANNGMTTAARSRLSGAMFRDNASFGAAQALTGNQGFRAQNAATQAREQGGRLGSQAQHNADMGRWKKLNSWANQMSGQAAAYGHFAGGMDPGSKPREMMGMAMSGMLGKDAKQKAGFFGDGAKNGFAAQASGAYNNLQAMSQNVATNKDGMMSNSAGFNAATGQYSGTLPTAGDGPSGGLNEPHQGVSGTEDYGTGAYFAFAAFGTDEGAQAVQGNAQQGYSFDPDAEKTSDEARAAHNSNTAAASQAAQDAFNGVDVAVPEPPAPPGDDG